MFRLYAFPYNNFSIPFQHITINILSDLNTWLFENIKEDVQALGIYTGAIPKG